MEMERPNRSDTHLSVEEESQIEAETRDHFEGLAPKRHSKPQRSDHSSSYRDANTDGDAIPEYAEFQRLETDQEKLVYNSNSGKPSEEFVETDYYKDLNLVDKQHHTTGTGFIKAGSMKTNNAYHLEEDTQDSYATGCCNESCHGNPATNDWIPASPVNADLASGKPSRSDI